GARAGPQPAGHPRLRGALGGGDPGQDRPGAHRFRSQHAYARFTATAPLPVWSGNTSGTVRLNRGGNRAVNCALHRIAITPTRGIGPGKPSGDKLLASGKTRTEAPRLLRHRLSDAAYHALLTDEQATAQHPSTSTDKVPPRAA
ncbi:MAG TPA: transposase, partial [Pseudonocardiaceae bacterium]|nr:transposase [Pseudonocardiaceae bacterium]